MMLNSVIDGFELNQLNIMGKTRNKITKPQIRAWDTAQELTGQEVRRIVLGAEQNVILAFFWGS